MATTNAFNATYPASSRRAYMSITPFHTSIFSYTVTQSSTPPYGTTGTLTSLSAGGTGTAINCPAGRVLRETGKRLYPSANPGVSTLMVGVFDAISGFKGFIDPNDSDFTIYNSDRPAYLGDAVSATDGTTIDKAPGVYTLGAVVSQSYIAGGVVPLTLYATGLTGGAYTNQTSADTFINPLLGNVFTLTTPTTLTTTLNLYCASFSGGVATAIVPPAGSTITVVVSVGATSGGNTLDIVSATGLRMNSLANMTASTVYTLTFVSDGVKLLQTGVVGGYTYSP